MGPTCAWGRQQCEMLSAPQEQALCCSLFANCLYVSEGDSPRVNLQSFLRDIQQRNPEPGVKPHAAPPLC